MKKILMMTLTAIMTIALMGCAKEETREVTILMWGGNDMVNTYMDDYVAKHMAEEGITLKRVPMDAADFLTKLTNEKKAGEMEGTADLLWINAENFLTAKESGLLYGPFTDQLTHLQTYYDPNDSDLTYDSGIPIEGYEAIWGKAQLVLTYDQSRLQNPPSSYADFMDYAKENPGTLTFPLIPDDFVGTVFLRNAYYEITGEVDIFQEDMTREAFETLSEPVMAYFNELKPYLWNGGESFPATQARMDELFANGEIAMTMGFEIGKTEGQVEAGIYPDSVRTYVFDTGTIGNSHYLAIPFNATHTEDAIKVIDFLQSPQAQIEKMKPTVWGDMPAIDPTRLTDEQRLLLEQAETSEITLSLDELAAHRLPEMRSEYIQWMKEMWMEQVGGQ